MRHVTTNRHTGSTKPRVHDRSGGAREESAVSLEAMAHELRFLHGVRVAHDAENSDPPVDP